MTSHRSLASSWLHHFMFSHMLGEANRHATPQDLTLSTARLITHPQLTACLVDGSHCCSNAAGTAHSHAFDADRVYLVPDAWSMLRSWPLHDTAHVVQMPSSIPQALACQLAAPLPYRMPHSSELRPQSSCWQPWLRWGRPCFCGAACARLFNEPPGETTICWLSSLAMQWLKRQM